MLLSGCFNSVDLTDVKTEVSNYNDNIITSNVNSYYSSVNITDSDLSDGKGFSSGNYITLVITSENSVDRASIKEAVSVTGLTNNTEGIGVGFKAGFGEALTYNIYTVYESTSYGSADVRTTITLDVNLESYVMDKLAVKVDATKLKDVKGFAFLNGNDNETLGEETDSSIFTLSVSDATDTITSDTSFVVAPTLDYYLIKTISLMQTETSLALISLFRPLLKYTMLPQEWLSPSMTTVHQK